MEVTIQYKFLVNTQSDASGRRLFRSFQPGDQLTVGGEGVVLPEALGLPAAISLAEHAYRAAGELFRLFNADGERPGHYRGPSMSVGDVIVFDGLDDAFGVDPAGFRVIPRKALNEGAVLPTPEKWTGK